MLSQATRSALLPGVLGERTLHHLGRGLGEPGQRDLACPRHVRDEELVDGQVHALREGVPPALAAGRDGLEMLDGRAALGS
jgi:hypothetical protein